MKPGLKQAAYKLVCGKINRFFFKMPGSKTLRSKGDWYEHDPFSELAEPDGLGCWVPLRQHPRLPVPSTWTSNHKQRWPDDAPEGKCWKCPDCESWAVLGGNAGFHRSKAHHGDPVLQDIPKKAEPEVPRLVVCEAMLMEDGHVITGIRHYSPEMRTTLQKAYGDGYHKQGFVDQAGKFLSREDAWEIAEAQGQIRRQVSTPGTLYSENLY